jgi:hypothetical protein
MALIEILDRHGLSQSSVARAIGVHTVTMWEWCRRGVVPRGRHMAMLLNHLRTYEPEISAGDVVSSKGVSDA